MISVQKIILGITLAAPIGPVSVEMIKRGLRHGFWSAFNIRLGGAIGNTICLIGAFFGLSALQSQQWLLLSLGLAGSALLCYMGVTTIIKGFKKIHINLDETDSVKGNAFYQSLGLGFMLAVFNPVGIVFWLSIFANSVEPGTSVSVSHFLLNLQIILGVLLWGALLSLVCDMTGRVINPRLLKWITVGSGLVLCYFGITYGLKLLAF